MRVGPSSAGIGSASGWAMTGGAAPDAATSAGSASTALATTSSPRSPASAPADTPSSSSSARDGGCARFDRMAKVAESSDSEDSAVHRMDASRTTWRGQLSAGTPTPAPEPTSVPLPTVPDWSRSSIAHP